MKTILLPWWRQLGNVFLCLLFCGLLSGAPETERIEFLRAEIKRHDALYFQAAKPEISDAEYDALKRELRELEARFPNLAAPDSPTQRVGADAADSFFKRERHRAPMLSLDNTYNEDDMRAFDQRVRKQLQQSGGEAAVAARLRYVVEPKIDGAGVSFVYERGRLARVLTRGDGLAGDDIAANVRAIRELPQQLRDGGGGVPDFIEIRGEIFMTFADFKRINDGRAEAGLPAFANPRNLAAGTMKLHDADEAAERGLHVFVYGMGACEPGAMRAPITGQAEMLARFRAWGLPVVENFRVVETYGALAAAIRELGESCAKLAYPIDGAVVKVDDFAAQRALGASAAAPRWAIAYKYAPKSAETRVRAITLQVGRTGVLTPVAELEPVMLAGTRITRASLHNPQEMIRKGVRVGDVVVVEKAGEIIPEIVRVKTEARADAPPFAFPKNCPECATPLVCGGFARDGDAAARAEGAEGGAGGAERAGGAGGLANRCPNADCPAQVRRRVAHFASKGCVDIAGLGAGVVGRLVSGGLVKDAADLYELRAEQIAALNGFGEKSAAKLTAAIDASRRAELWRVICGLGIEGVGPATAKALAKHFGTLGAFAAADAAAFEAIPGVGGKAVAGIVAFRGEPANRALLERLAKAGVGAAMRAP